MFFPELNYEINRFSPQWSKLLRVYSAQMRKRNPVLDYVSSKEESPDRFIRKVLTMADAIKGIR
jgi:hypothetical protein